MTTKYSPQMIEAGKIKHRRIISMTTLVVGILGSLIVSLILHKHDIILGFPRIYFLVGVAALTIIIVYIQNSQLNYLEEVFGWDNSFEKFKMNRLARWIDDIYNDYIGDSSEKDLSELLGKKVKEVYDEPYVVETQKDGTVLFRHLNKSEEEKVLKWLGKISKKP